MSKPTSTPQPKGFPWWLLLIFIGIGAILLMNQYKDVDFIVEDEEGNLTLSEERQEKLERKLKELEEAEQYVLRAREPAYYPCYSCPDTNVIFLLPGEVWRYGVTTKRQKGRYDEKYIEENRLIYFVQFEGTLQACLIEEQKKIYHYALLPENLKRSIPLIRPPGNKIDN
ncbi:MAG: hypothetical protein AAF849_24625 [Bacteroidota bacterium]